MFMKNLFEVIGYFLLIGLPIFLVVSFFCPKLQELIKKNSISLTFLLFLSLILPIYDRITEVDILGFKAKLQEATDIVNHLKSLESRFKSMFEEYGEIIQLYESAISNGGSEEAYLKLKNKSQKSTLENIAKIKIDSVKSAMQIYMNFLQSWRLDWPAQGKTLSNEQLHTIWLVGFLAWADLKYDQSMKWEIRGRAAQLLSSRKEWPVPDKLIEVIKDKNKLIVKVIALQSFEDLMSDFGYKRKDLFDFQDAILWWDKNRDSIKTRLPQMVN